MKVLMLCPNTKKCSIIKNRGHCPGGHERIHEQATACATKCEYVGTTRHCACRKATEAEVLVNVY